MTANKIIIVNLHRATQTEWNGYWCKPYNLKLFQNDFNNWTSGNDKIDKLIQDAQLNANDNWEVIE
ncbi:hypothetical protein Glove_173g58 [Diversispora epigaea]|uniref:Uncharacterized protein n=1 Tax=Diversispora epigaea TaxID=1348612 RepID=A0A397IVI3_9GLOM|nr:hypothetical protein Glove_173g58 [Diversispora epigaea]